MSDTTTKYQNLKGFVGPAGSGYTTSRQGLNSKQPLPEAGRVLRFQNAVSKLLPGNPVRTKDVAIFTRQMAATLSAGLLLTEALEIVSDDMENKYFRGALQHICANIRGGLDFSSALSKYKHIFPAAYIAIVRSGEATGKLDTTLANLADYLEKTEYLKQQIKSAIRYPAFVLVFSMVVALVMVVFLIPRFKDMYMQADVALPMMTQMIIGFSDWVINHLQLFIISIMAAIFLFHYLLRVEKFKHFIDVVKIRLPLIGKTIILKGIISQYCRTMYFLLAGGVSLSTSMQITARVCDHVLMQKAIENIKDSVMCGSSISSEMGNHKIFPPLAVKMVKVGERTGSLPEMLRRTAKYYDDEIDIGIKNLIQMIEPTLIIIIGCGVAFVVVALYLPIFNLSTLIK